MVGECLPFSILRGVQKHLHKNGWSVYANAPAGLITDRGFTGHEHIDLFDLVNMDGRVYDPVIGRFLSADPVIQDPENLQSLNRYSYCMNNPLSLTDPSGYSWLSDNWRSLVAAGIAIVASVVTAGLLAPGGFAALSTLTIWGATGAGAVGGFAGGFSGALLSGGDLGQALVAGVVGGVIGAATGFLSFAAGSVSSNGLTAILERMAKHAFVSAWLSGIQGQNIWSAALTGGISSLGGEGLDYIKDAPEFALVAASAIVGGTVSVIGGGKFANGAVTGAFTEEFNHLVHQANKYKTLKLTYNAYQISYGLEDVGVNSGIGVKGGINIYVDPQSGEWKLDVTANVPENAIEHNESDVKFCGTAKLYINGEVAGIESFTPSASSYTPLGSHQLGSASFYLPSTGSVSLVIQASAIISRFEGNDSRGASYTIPIYK